LLHNATVAPTRKDDMLRAERAGHFTFRRHVDFLHTLLELMKPDLLALLSMQ